MRARTRARTGAGAGAGAIKPTAYLSYRHGVRFIHNRNEYVCYSVYADEDEHR